MTEENTSPLRRSEGSGCPPDNPEHAGGMFTLNWPLATLRCADSGPRLRGGDEEIL